LTSEWVDTLRILNFDRDSYNCILSALYKSLSEHKPVSAMNVIKECTKCPPHRIVAFFVKLNEMGILIEIKERDQSPNTLAECKYIVNQNELSSFSLKMGIALEVSELLGSQNASYHVMATIPPGTSITKSYVNLKKRILPIYETIVDLIIRAESEIIIVSPFFDEKGLEKISRPLLDKLLMKVRVEIVTRSYKNNASNFKFLQQLINQAYAKKTIEYLSIFEYQNMNTDEYASDTFHAKTMIIDEGKKAYLGSANFTGWGLDEQFELGVLLEGGSAKILHEMIRYMKEAGLIKKTMITHNT